jgi:hypothetical protein
MGITNKNKYIVSFKKDLVTFLNIHPTCRTLYDLKNFIILNTKYDIKSDLIELSKSYKIFFSIDNDTIYLSSLLSIIVLKYINNNLPNILYYQYYQKPIEIIEL